MFVFVFYWLVSWGGDKTDHHSVPMWFMDLESPAGGHWEDNRLLFGWVESFVALSDFPRLSWVQARQRCCAVPFTPASLGPQHPCTRWWTVSGGALMEVPEHVRPHSKGCKNTWSLWACCSSIPTGNPICSTHVQEGFFLVLPFTIKAYTRKLDLQHKQLNKNYI